MTEDKLSQEILNQLKAKAIDEMVSKNDYPDGTCSLEHLEYMSAEDVAEHLRMLYKSMVWACIVVSQKSSHISS